MALTQEERDKLKRAWLAVTGLRWSVMKGGGRGGDTGETPDSSEARTLGRGSEPG